MSSVMYPDAKHHTRLIRHKAQDIQYEVSSSFLSWLYKVYLSGIENRETFRKNRIWSLSQMTPEEERFSKFFASEIILVHGLSDLMLEAKREELVDIITEARAKLTAIEHEKNERKNKKTGGIRPFESAINSDIKTSEAINQINKRAERISKMDRVLKNLIAMGMSEEEAKQTLSARNIVDKLGDKPEIRDVVTVGDNGITGPKFVNPFGRKKEEFQKIDDNGNKIEVANEVSKPFVNPFKKKE